MPGRLPEDLRTGALPSGPRSRRAPEDPLGQSEGNPAFVLDANANPPAQLGGAAGYYRGVGTVLFNMAVNPVNGKVYVSNTEAGNDKRFEGPGEFAGHSVRGHLHESRITVLGRRGSVTPRHLNKHINYDEMLRRDPERRE